MYKLVNDYIIMERKFNCKSIIIIPLADLHIGASNCKMKEIKSVIDYIAKNKNVYCTLGGDIIDNAVLVGKNLGVFDSSKTPINQIKEAVELLRPIKDKILCAVSGNHEARSEKVADINPMYLIMSELGIQDRYRRNLSIIKVLIGNKNGTADTGKLQCYAILVHHGKGTSESAIKKDLEFLNKFEGADLIFTGHTHHGRVAREMIHSLNKHNNIATEREKIAIVTNSFLDDADYAISNMMVGNNSKIIKVMLSSGKKKDVQIIW